METAVPRYFLIISCFSLIFSSALPQESTNRTICQTKECLSTAKILNESMSSKANPCDNFYTYACGHWPKINRTRRSMPQTTLRLRSEQNYREIINFLRSGINPNESEAVVKAKKFYSQCLDNGACASEVEQIENILKEIGLPNIPYEENVNRNIDYATALARAYKLAGVKIYFNLGVSPNPYNQTENMITLKGPSMHVIDASNVSNAESRTLKAPPEDKRIQVRDYVGKIVAAMCKNSTSTICALPSDPSRSEPHDWLIDQVISLNNDLAKFMQRATRSQNTNSTPDIDIYTLHQLQALSDRIANEVNASIPKLNWTRYMEEMFSGLDNVTLDLDNPNKVLIAIENIDFVKEMLEFIYIKRLNVMSIECDIWWQVVSFFLPYIDLSISEAKNNLAASAGFRPTREGHCAEITISSFAMAITYGYSNKEQHEKAKTKIAKIFEHIRRSFKEKINEATWMDEKTKEKALVKLKFMKTDIAYPSTINDTSKLNNVYRGVNISDNFFNTMLSKIQVHIKKALNRLSQSNDLNKEYYATPDTMNGFYIRDKNVIVIPPSLIGEPIYSDSLRAWDYGAIGSILGQKMTRALDDSGGHYNELGNIENWWRNETLNLYKEKVDCFVEAYAKYNVSLRNGVKLFTNATEKKASRDESISDNVGFMLSLLAYRKSVSELGEEPLLPEFQHLTHEQLLTLAQANVLCENPVWTLGTNKVRYRSLSIFRVNGVFKNSKEFSEIWNCPKNSPMNPSDKCSIW